jgi:hypothetical protein
VIIQKAFLLDQFPVMDILINEATKGLRGKLAREATNFLTLYSCKQLFEPILPSDAIRIDKGEELPPCGPDAGIPCVSHSSPPFIDADDGITVDYFFRVIGGMIIDDNDLVSVRWIIEVQQGFNTVPDPLCFVVCRYDHRNVKSFTIYHVTQRNWPPYEIRRVIFDGPV